MWGMKKVTVLPVVIGSLGAVAKEFHKWIENVGINLRAGHLQKQHC